MPEPYCPRREEARAIVAGMRQQDGVRRRGDRRARLEALAAELGLKLPVRIELAGMLTDHVERDVRGQLARAWNACRVTLRVHSPGGLARVGAAIAGDLDELRRMGVPIEGFTSGLCASAAADVFVACTRRRCAPEAQFILHARAAPDAGRLTPAALRRLARELEQQDDEVLAQFAARGVHLPQRAVDELKAGADVRLDARGAFACNLVHLINGEGTPTETIDARRILGAYPAAAQAAYRAASGELR